MALPNTFAAQTAPVMTALDQNFNAVGNMGGFPCAVTGTDDLVLTPTAGITPAVSAYANYKLFSGVVVTTNTTALTARIGALAILNVYKDSPAGPVVCSGGELIAGCMFTLRYNSALNAGAGGFHLTSNTAYAGGTVSGNIIGPPQISGGTVTGTALMTAPTLTATTLATVARLMVGATAASITHILSGSGTLTYTVVPANTTQQQTLAVPGAQINDVVSVGPPASVVTGTHFTGYVMAAGTVAVVAVNSTAASLTPLTGIYRVAVTGFT